jgi:hypothetical protein
MSVIRRTTGRIRKAAALAAAVLALPGIVFAQASGDALRRLGTVGNRVYGSSQQTLPQIVGGVIQVALGLIGVVLLVLLIYSGYLWMTAQGNEEQVKKAKSMLRNAVIGMIIIFAAYAITTFVVQQLVYGPFYNAGQYPGAGSNPPPSPGASIPGAAGPTGFSN